jgi:hypothetical protein
MQSSEVEVVVDYSGLQPRVNVTDMFGDDLSDFPELLSYNFPLFSSPSSFWLYFITPPSSPQEYVMRLPPFCSEFQLLGLEEVSYSPLNDVPSWYTYGDASAPSVVAISFSTVSGEAAVVTALQGLATWADTAVTYLPAATINVARIVCSTTNILSTFSDTNEPCWLVDLDAPSLSIVYNHVVQPGRREAGVLPPSVMELLSDTNAHALFSRFNHLTRTHVEKRVTPLAETIASPPLDPAPLFTEAPPPSRVDATGLTTGDWVIYLAPSGDSFVTSQVREVRGSSLLLQNDDTPEFVAKFDHVNHDFITELKPVASFFVS